MKLSGNLPVSLKLSTSGLAFSVVPKTSLYFSYNVTFSGLLAPFPVLLAPLAFLERGNPRFNNNLKIIVLYNNTSKDYYFIMR